MSVQPLNFGALSLSQTPRHRSPLEFGTALAGIWLKLRLFNILAALSVNRYPERGTVLDSRIYLAKIQTKYRRKGPHPAKVPKRGTDRRDVE